MQLPTSLNPTPRRKSIGFAAKYVVSQQNVRANISPQIKCLPHTYGFKLLIVVPFVFVSSLNGFAWYEVTCRTFHKELPGVLLYLVLVLSGRFVRVRFQRQKFITNLFGLRSAGDHLYI